MEKTQTAGADGSPRRSRWSILGWVAAGAALAAFVAANRSQVPAAARALGAARPGYVALALGVCLAGVANQAALHHRAQRAVGLGPRFGASLRAGAAAQFLNLVAKSGGMAGLGAFLRSRAGRDASGPVVVAYVLATLLGQLSFAVVLGVSLVLIWADGRLTAADVAASVVFAAIMAAAVGALVAGVRSREALRRVHALPARVARRARALVGRPGKQAAVTGPAEEDHRSADDLYEAVQVLARRPQAAAGATAHAFGVEALGALLVWSVLRAVGEHPGLRLAVMAYAISVLFAIVGFLPGGLGFVEAGMGSVLVSYGVAGPVAVAAVVLYRLFELWVPVVVGAWAAQSLARAATLR